MRLPGMWMPWFSGKKLGIVPHGNRLPVFSERYGHYWVKRIGPYKLVVRPRFNGTGCRDWYGLFLE